MKRTPRPDELKLWARVAATVRPGPGRAAPVVASEVETVRADPQPAPPAPPKPLISSPKAADRVRPRVSAPGAIEPGRMRRLTRERDPIGPKLDLHGLDQDRARAILSSFLRQAREEGWRTVLVITGKGTRGDGVLRRRAPEWLAEPGLRDLVAGVSSAHRRHGGDGALYVALKRPANPSR